MRAWPCGPQADHAAGRRRSTRLGRCKKKCLPLPPGAKDELSAGAKASSHESYEIHDPYLTVKLIRPRPPADPYRSAHEIEDQRERRAGMLVRCQGPFR